MSQDKSVQKGHTNQLKVQLILWKWLRPGRLHEAEGKAGAMGEVLPIQVGVVANSPL